MAKILSISSQVVCGSVGNSVTQFTLQRLGHEVWGLPSVLLSNHPGHKIYGGARLGSKILRPVLEALEFAGHLKQVDMVMTGYLPSKEHVFIALDALKLVRKLNPNVIYLYDPALGDDCRPGSPEGLYIDVKAAECQRAELLPLADIVTPNRFELEWLTMRPVMDPQTALVAIDQFGNDRVLATSIPGISGRLLNLLAGDHQPLAASVKQFDCAPQGTGDLIAALYAASILNGDAQERALGLATKGVETVLRASEGMDELNLIGSQEDWSMVEPAKVSQIEYIPA
ncbi:MAG: pyridoxal kinase [bacterium]|nr:pyridoxal kinase [bacterium]